jgi:hypothetical protein
METYYSLVSDELLNKLSQVKQFIKKHNPTIGLLTEVILREFLKDYLPKSVSVEQGFIMSASGEVSKQCDILIYDSFHFAPFYKVNDVVIVSEQAVIAVIEVKTTLNKQIFKDVVAYFKNISTITQAKTYLFIYNSPGVSNLEGYFLSYKHSGQHQQFDHDTFQYLPDEITGLTSSYHLKKAYVVIERDAMGYDSWFFENKEGTEISALQNFFLSVSEAVKDFMERSAEERKSRLPEAVSSNRLRSYFAIELFDA